MFLVVLKPGGIREPHWHPDAWEFDYCISGTARMSVVGPNNEWKMFDVKPGRWRSCRWDSFIIPRISASRICISSYRSTTAGRKATTISAFRSRSAVPEPRAGGDFRGPEVGFRTGAEVAPGSLDRIGQVTAVVPRRRRSSPGSAPSVQAGTALDDRRARTCNFAIPALKPERRSRRPTNDDALHHYGRHHRFAAAEVRQPGRADHRRRADRVDAGGIRGGRHPGPRACAQGRRHSNSDPERSGGWSRACASIAPA